MAFSHVICAIAVLLAAVIGGCATLPDPLRGNLSSDLFPVRSCASWFRALDQAVDQAGVGDAGAFRVPGYPYLRADRFLASFRGPAMANDAAFNVWLKRMRAMDLEARRFEVRNLPLPLLQELGISEREQAIARSDECAAELARNDLASARSRTSLGARVQVPDDYSDWLRAVGLYGLTRIPFEKGVERWHAEVAAMFRQSHEGSGTAPAYQRFEPSMSPAMTREGFAEILRRSGRDALGVPQIAESDLESLFAAFAPVFEIETTGAYDRFGQVVWRDIRTPDVDSSSPAVYHRLAFTRYGGETLVQLVYTIWFSERPSDHILDVFAGRLDGVVLRVTLRADGEALVYDSIHPCGCYHLFFPTPFAEPRPAPEPGDEWAFIPARLPAIAAGQRIVVRVATRTHYLLDIAPDPGGARQDFYQFLGENSLRSLPSGEGAWRSVYGPDGLVRGTERGERMLFWPMGIASAGAMRQWGRHATAFLGRRHFDDADLIERRFSIVLR